MKRIFSIITFALSLGLTTPIVAQTKTAEQWAVINSSVGYLRAKPDYESGLESQSLMGTVVKIKEARSYWRKVDVPDYKDVWINEGVLSLLTADEKEEYEAAAKWICTARVTLLYEQPDENAGVVAEMIMGNLVRKVGESTNDWTQVLMANGVMAWVKSDALENYQDWLNNRKPSADAIIASAKQYLGVPYLWGGISVKGFDCSGLVKWAYFLNGIELPRNAREQILLGEVVPCEIEAMRPGDLVFFGRAATAERPMAVTHVALYIGEGRIIHSSQIVKIQTLLPSYKDSYNRQPIAVRRILK